MTSMVALLAVIRSKLLVLIIWTLAGAAVAGGINLLLPVVFEARTKILIATPYWNDNTALDDPNFGGGTTLAYGDEFTQQRMMSYSKLVTTSMVTAPVTERLRLNETGDELATKLTGRVIPETVMLEVRARDASPTKAAAIADAAAQQTIDVIKGVERPPYTMASPVQPVLFQPASVPVRPISPRTLLNIVCGAVIGFLFGLTYVAAYAASRRARRLARIRGGDDRLPDDELNGVLGVLAADDYLPVGRVDNEARLLRIEVEDRLADAGVQSLVMTSPRATPATNRVAALLAIALAEAGAPTIVVGTDFTAQHDDSTVGLGELLSGTGTLDSAIQIDERIGLNWIPAGVAPEDPTRELMGTKMRDLLSDLEGRYRYVIVVGPATLELADAVDMASLSGAAILVDPFPQTTAAELRESERLLRLARGTYLGRVVVVDRSFSEDVEMSQFDPQRPVASGQSNALNGEQWNY